MSVFEGFSEIEKENLLKKLSAKVLVFKKNALILTNANNINALSIVIKGKAQIIRIDYNGNKTIIETLNVDDVFDPQMFNMDNNELTIIALEDTEIILIEYTAITNNSLSSNLLLQNLTKVIIKYLNRSYERIQILTKKTIRDKLLEYFKYVSNKKNKKTFKLPLGISDLANYLAIDRSSLSRELKLLKEEGFIVLENKIIKLNY